MQGMRWRRRKQREREREGGKGGSRGSPGQLCCFVDMTLSHAIVLVEYTRDGHSRIEKKKKKNNPFGINFPENYNEWVVTEKRWCYYEKQCTDRTQILGISNPCLYKQIQYLFAKLGTWIDIDLFERIVYRLRIRKWRKIWFLAIAFSLISQLNASE